MFDFLRDLILGPGLYLICFIAGMCFKRYVLDIIKNYVVNKLKPGIIQNYLEDALGLNKKQVVPPVVIMPLNQPEVAKPVVAPVIPAVVAPVAPVVQAEAVVPPVVQQ